MREVAMKPDVLVVIGVGGMGQAIARRLGSGKTVLLADYNDETLQAAAASLSDDGQQVQTCSVDVSSAESVSALAKEAAAFGSVTQVAHTAGLSPSQAPTAAILAVDLLGVALVLDEFAKVIAAGGTGVVIASMAGHMFPPLTPEQEQAVVRTPAQYLLRLPFINPPEVTEPGHAYGIAKRVNHIQVQAASKVWGERGARINSISPGIISTPMSQQELASPLGDGMRSMIAASAARRVGTPDDIAAAAEYLLGPHASFVTGTDLLVDGGVTAALRAG
jgi:NAD(P)-dependent dehydrogenase (short-subunit alcohol dehydrogenase family)